MEHSVAQHHHLIDTIINILLFFFIPGCVVPLLQRVRISPVLGYLGCGMVIGPFGMAQLVEAYPWVAHISVDDMDTVHMLGELGIIALMFMIGLELSLGRLKELKRFIFGLGSAQIGLSALVIFLIALAFDNDVQAAVLMGASFALSSTAIVMGLLEERKLSNQPIGILCFSILLMQDLAVVPILVLATTLGGQEHTGIVVALATALVVGALTVAAMYGLGKKVLRPLLHSVSRATTSEWLVAFVAFIVLGCAALTYLAGMSLALGAFLAGLLIAETEFKHEVEVIINPIKGMLLGVFFLSIGMMVDLQALLHNPLWVLLGVLGIYVLKACIIFGLCRAFRVPARHAAEASVYLAQPGEFALMILGVAMSSQLMPADDVQFFLLVTVVAMMLSPLLFRLAPAAGHLGHRWLGHTRDELNFTAATHTHCVVIAGFGRVGQSIASTLDEQHIPYIAFDTDAQRVQHFKAQHVNIIYGDARKTALWHHMISEHIQAAVIAIDDHKATAPIITSLRTHFPNLPVIARAKHTQDANTLHNQGANFVVEETKEASIKITKIISNILK